MKRNPATFAATWNASTTLAEAVAALGGTENAVRQYAYCLRRRGVALKDFRRAVAERPRHSLPQLFYAAKAVGEEAGAPGEAA